MIVGLTGGIGSGKSLVAKMFEALGVPVFDADRAGKTLLDDDQSVKDQVRALFGDSIYIDGKADRRAIANRVFDDATLLNQLNSIIHPAVKLAFDEWHTNQKDVPFVLREAAILFESGSYKTCDHVVAVIAPVEVRIERVMKRDNTSREAVLARMAKQWTNGQVREKADFIIENDGRQTLIPQVVTLKASLDALQ